MDEPTAGLNKNLAENHQSDSLKEILTEFFEPENLQNIFQSAFDNKNNNEKLKSFFNNLNNDLKSKIELLPKNIQNEIKNFIDNLISNIDLENIDFNKISEKLNNILNEIFKTEESQQEHIFQDLQPVQPGNPQNIEIETENENHISIQ